MDKRFIDAINADDFVTVRDMLKNRLLMDHDVNGGMFDECWTECERTGIISKIFQAHDGREISDEVSENNYNSLVGQLATNFSEIRLKKILFLAKEIWPNEQSNIKTTLNENNKESSSNITYENDSGRVVSARILEEREIPNGNSQNASGKSNHSNENNDSNLGVVLAVAAVAAVAVIAGVVIFG